MSLDLADLKRLKITKDTVSWLRGKCAATGRSHQEIARDALHSVAVQEIHEAKILASFALSEGHVGDSYVKPGTAGGRR